MNQKKQSIQLLNKSAHHALNNQNYPLALNLFKKAYLLDPEEENNLLNVSYTFDKLGQFEPGLIAAQIRSLEYRQKWQIFYGLNRLWKGSLDSEQIILISDYMYGETICNSYWGQLLRAAGIHSTIYCDKRLAPLYEKNNVFDSVVVVDRELLVQDKYPSFSEEWTPVSPLLYSMTTHCGLRNIHLPIFDCDQQDLKTFHQSFLSREVGRKLIGINWACSSISSPRSIPLEAFQPLSRIPHSTLVSLQKPPGIDQLSGCSFVDKFIYMQSNLSAQEDFYCTALAIKSCSCIITCDTAVAHLCGFMGVPTFLLLNSTHDGRWGDRDVYPLYPTVKLRRNNLQSWHMILVDIANEIANGNLI